MSAWVSWAVERLKPRYEEVRAKALVVYGPASSNFETIAPLLR